MSKEKRYFPNLNGIRCIAALMVVFHHLEQAKYAQHIPNIYSAAIVQHAGRLGVGLFFVLSGFLITYLLLEEKGKFGSINTTKFYLRRAFRIWPIYFLMIILSLFVFPHVPLLDYPGIRETLSVHTSERNLLLFLVLPNYAFVLYDLPYWCAQAWSIGVEEQFYYLWPWLIKYPKRRFGILTLFLAFSALLLLSALYNREDVNYQEKMEMVYTFLGQFRIQTMALGGFTAWLVYSEKTKILEFLFRKDVQLAAYFLLFVMFLSGIHFNGFLELYSIFFCFFVLNVSCNPNTVISLENKVMNHLGKVSYGLYLYHVAAIIFAGNLIRAYLPDLQEIPYQIILYIFSVLLSIGIASLSYSYFERPLLGYKDKKFGR